MKAGIKTALVIGATGYIGRHIIAALLREHPDATVFGLSRNGMPNAKGWRSLEGNLLDPQLPKLLAELQPDVIYLATATDKAAPLKEQLGLYVEGTRHLLDSVVETQIESKIVVLGSAAEYGYGDLPMTESTEANPQGEYGIAKLAQTQLSLLYARRYNLPIAVARIFNAYGESPKTYVTASIAAQLAKLEIDERVKIPHIKVFNLNGWRDFIHVGEVANALVALGETSLKTGETYNIGSGESHSVQFVLEHLLSLSSIKEYEISPNGPQQEERSQAVITKVIQDTSWHPKLSLEEGLQAELDYWRGEIKLLAGKF